MDDRTTNRLNDKFDFGEFNEKQLSIQKLVALVDMTGAPIKQPQPTYHSGGGKEGCSDAE